MEFLVHIFQIEEMTEWVIQTPTLPPTPPLSITTKNHSGGGDNKQEIRVLCQYSDQEE